MQPKKPQFPRAAGLSPAQVNQHAPRYADRRTKRERDKGAQKRNAIDRSRKGE